LMMAITIFMALAFPVSARRPRNQGERTKLK